MQFAKDTNVSVEKSQAELKSLLAKYGANKTGLSEDHDNGEAMVQFVCKERLVRFRLTLPKRSEKVFWFTAHKNPQRRSDDAAYKLWEQSCRQRWRALVLCIRAKLESVECGISEFEDEFLAHVVLASGRTVGETVRPQVAQCYLNGTPIEGIPLRLESKS